MNILFLTSHLPMPTISGGRVREYEILKQLSKYANVYLCITTKTYNFDIQNIEKIKKYVKEVNVFRAFKATNHRIVSGKCSQVKRNFSFEAQSYISSLSKRVDIDIVHLEGFYMYEQVRHLLDIPIILAEQNIEYDLFALKIENATDDDVDDLKREMYLTRLDEVEVWKNVDFCITLTTYDYNIVNKYIPQDRIAKISLGINNTFNDFENSDSPIEMQTDANPMLLYVGNFLYAPNQDAIEYYFSEIHERILELFPNLKLIIVGNESNTKLREYKKIKGVDILGKVDSLTPYYDMCDIFICPLRVGGGVKVKMLEAISRGKAIVTSQIGSQGLDSENGNNFLVANSPTEFVNEINAILSDVELKRRLETNCYNYSKKLRSWPEIVKEMHELYLEITHK